MDGNSSNFTLRPGTVLGGHFRIQQVLGAGGFGITYKAVDTQLGRIVAVKEYYPHQWVQRYSAETANVTPCTEKQAVMFEKMKTKFISEARIMAQHDSDRCIVRVHDFFTDNNTAYIVMEFLDGMTLHSYVEKYGAMDVEMLCRLILPVMRSLDALHQDKLIHRDIAPDNIMLMQDSTGGRLLKLMDFGAARSFAEESQQSKSVILKHGFAPFEQYKQHGSQGAWTDIYALSATLYYCITGRVPDRATDRIPTDGLLRPSEAGGVLRPEIEAVIMKGMQVGAADRYQTAVDMADDLQQALNLGGSILMDGGGMEDTPRSLFAEPTADSVAQSKPDVGKKEPVPAERSSRGKTGTELICDENGQTSAAAMNTGDGTAPSSSGYAPTEKQANVSGKATVLTEEGHESAGDAPTPAGEASAVPQNVPVQPIGGKQQKAEVTPKQKHGFRFAIPLPSFDFLKRKNEKKAPEERKSSRQHRDAQPGPAEPHDPAPRTDDSLLRKLKRPSVSPESDRRQRRFNIGIPLPSLDFLRRGKASSRREQSSVIDLSLKDEPINPGPPPSFRKGAGKDASNRKKTGGNSVADDLFESVKLYDDPNSPYYRGTSGSGSDVSENGMYDPEDWFPDPLITRKKRRSLGIGLPEIEPAVLLAIGAGFVFVLAVILILILL